MSQKIKILDEEWDWKNLTLWDFLTEGNYPSNWKEFFLKDDIQKDLEKISKELVNESGNCVIFPPIHKTFRAFCIPLEKIKVIVLGQDPYSDPGAAVGFCFSVPKGNKINPSLRNIYTELENCGFEPTKDGNLSHWVNQGCLMLNTALTVEKGNPDSHTHIWYDFIEKLLQYISENTQSVAWLLMGAKAEVFKKFADKNGHKAFITSHPSPFSAHKGFRGYPAFLGSKIFTKINEFIEPKISW